MATVLEGRGRAGSANHDVRDSRLPPSTSCTMEGVDVAFGRHIDRHGLAAVRRTAESRPGAGPRGLAAVATEYEEQAQADSHADQSAHLLLSDELEVIFSRVVRHVSHYV